MPMKSLKRTFKSIPKAKNSAEAIFRKAIQDKVELCEKINELEEEVDRLERCKTREGANLEYLKNVITSFISTKEAEGKRHMMNAISSDTIQGNKRTPMDIVEGDFQRILGEDSSEKKSK